MPIPIPQKPKGPGKWGKASKQLSFWVLLVLSLAALFAVVRPGRLLLVSGLLLKYCRDWRRAGRPQM